jgi:hypothetical protein
MRETGCWIALRALGALAVALSISTGFGSGTRAAETQEAITVISDAPRNEFPTGVTFSVSFNAPAAEDQVRLRYRVAPDGTGASGVADCTGTGTITCTYTLQSGRGIFVIPGAEITYHWEIADSDGNEISTDEKLYVHEDTRFDFRTINEGNVTVYFHPGTEDEADSVLAAAVEALASVSALEQTQIDFPVKVFLYATADEMQPAIAPTGGRGVQILGEVVYSDTAMVSADVQTLDITRHEIAHIVTREATKGPFGIAGWMNEGISVYAQRQPLSGHDASLQSAIRNDRVLTFAELNSSATGGVASTVGLYYGQAGSIVKFLVEEYGADKFAELLRTFKDGATQDDAFERVYGLDALGIENAWRVSVGLDARAASPTATPQPTEDDAEPTPRSGTTAQDPGDDGDGDGFPIGATVIIGLLVIAVGSAGLFTFRVARERM